MVASFLDRLAAFGTINSHASELLGSIEQILLADCPIVRCRRRVAYAINRIAGHFAGAQLLSILVGVRKPQLHQASYCLGQTGRFLPETPSMP
ncbi:hypothetical protein [Bradyrhizobium sp. CCBAU 53351]|uniref:hypothetical protein n=1 Tax=Bradyrhizobium sp. CCBAU 53351 TaxID=1325114 RepID=UPI001888039D|nr:hypothetical protein [Bradyrhizobium sp. CCBAU 53351]